MTINERKSTPFWKKLIIIFITLLLFLIQLGFFGALIYMYYSMASSVYHGITGLIFGLSYVIGLFYVLYIISKPISSNYKTTWSVLILVAPLPFCALYTANSITRRSTKRRNDKILKELGERALKPTKKIRKLPNEIDSNIINVLSSSTYAPFCEGNDVKFFNDAKLKHFDMCENLKSAKEYILLEYFIISDGKCFDDIYEILQAKGHQGIKIYILYDDIGSKSFLTKRIASRLSLIPNAKICKFQPVSLSLSPTINYRDHRKICVIDGVISYCGGDNIADEYIHEIERFGYWRDNACRYIGSITHTFVNLFEETWYFSAKEKLDLPLNECKFEKKPGYEIAFGDGPTNAKNPGYDLFYSLINGARKYVFISTPYLIIDDALIHALCVKAKSGVDVCILMPGKPDKKSAYYMGRANYKRLLLNGVKIYEYSPGFNHAKNIIVDDKYAFCGTINMDNRSFFLHYECGALLMYNGEIEKIKDDYLKALNISRQITYNIWKKYPPYQKLVAFLLGIFSPMF